MAPMMERIELRLDQDLLARVDSWRDARMAEKPSRAEAIRSLVEIALGPGENKNVQFTDGERLLMLMLRDIHSGLKLKGSEVDFEFIAQTIYGGHYWAPKWVMSGLFHDYADKPEDVTLVVNVLDMWHFLENSYERLSKADKDRFAIEAPKYHTSVVFPGFDGNNETEHLGIARFLIEEMNRFGGFKGRELDSHHPTLSRYRRMVAAFLPIRSTLQGGVLSVDQILKIVKSGARAVINTDPDSQ